MSVRSVLLLVVVVAWFVFILTTNVYHKFFMVRL